MQNSSTQHNDGHRAQGRAAGDANQRRVSQRITKESLQGRTRHGQGRARENGQGDPRQAQIHHDVNRGIVNGGLAQADLVRQNL